MSPNPDSGMVMEDVEMTSAVPLATPEKSPKSIKKMTSEKKSHKKDRKRKVEEVSPPEVEEDDVDETTDEKSAKKAKVNLPKVSQQVKARLKVEDDFITDVLSHMYVPNHKKRFGLDGEEEEDEDDDVTMDDNISDAQRKLLFPKSTTRAQSAGELHDRLQQKLAAFKGNRKDRDFGKKGPKLTKVEKRKKAREAKKTKNKLSKAGGLIKSELKREAGDSWAGTQHGGGANAGIYNSEGKLVFSKFDFTEENSRPSTTANNEKSMTKDPKAALTKIKKQKEKLKSLKASGKGDAVKMIEESTAWKTAMDKTAGVKVKDDEGLLKKSIKKQEQKKKSSKKKWDARKDQVEKRKDAKQVKRSENINKRKESVKKGKLKKAAKRGRLVPGFG